MTPLPGERREHREPQVPTFTDWSVGTVREALREHEAGRFYGSAHLFEQLQRNPRIASALSTRVLAMAGLPGDLHPGDGDGRRNDAAVARLRPHWPCIAPLPIVADALRWTIGLGVALFEVVWRADEATGDWVPRLKPWHPCWLEWDDGAGRYAVLTRDGRVLVEPGAGDWLIVAHTEHRPWMRGVVRCLGIEDTIRGYAVRDWARFSEVHGIPIRLARVPAAGDDKDKQRFVGDLGAASLGSDTTVLAPKTGNEATDYGLELIEARDQAWQAFQQLISQCDTDTAIAILGNVFSTDSPSGVYVPKSNASGVRQDLMEADATAVPHCIRRDVTRPWARYNLGASAEDSAPRYCYRTAPPPDLNAEASTVKALGEGVQALNTAGGPQGKAVDFEAYVSRFGVPLKDVPKVEPAPAAPPGGAAGAKPATGAKPAAKLDDAAGEPDALLTGQVYVDAVADAALARAPAAVDPLLARVLIEVDASTSYEDLRARLARVLAEQNPSTAARLVRAAVLMAEAAGAWSVHATG